MKNKIVKVKTKKSLSRRIKVTGSGKILHRSNFKGHLRRNKTAKQKRGFKITKEFSKARDKSIRQAMGIKNES